MLIRLLPKRKSAITSALWRRRASVQRAFQSLLGIGAATEPTTYATLYNAERSQNQPGSS